MRKHKKLKAYSMLQIMGAILIAGILTALAVPSIMKAVTKAKQGEAKTQLEHIYSLERLYFLEFSKYSGDLEEIDFDQQTLVTEGGGARYKIEIVEAGTTTFTARATAVQDFDGDGVFNVWEINQDRKLTETIKD
ncbi:MAG: general secretion pathway protein GspG [Flavobacteriales bacterium CG18_big_fil_WC_8_21_14_2_50_32_9]|nr:MAG: general secretion pathway protein GspG [Flavobacteriales bacterium CG18_big_fil_WC_8_21_14_2_50_32_9]